MQAKMNDKLSIPNNQLAMSLFQQLTGKWNVNDVFSPLSISIGLAMVYLGAKQETAKEIREVLAYKSGGFKNDGEVHQAFKQTMDMLLGKHNDNKTFSFVVA